MENQQKQTVKKEEINPMVAAMTGAVVGAGVVVAMAGAVVLQDQKNRKKVKEVLVNAKDKAVDYIEGVQNRVQDKNLELKEKIDAKLAEGEMKVEELKNATEQALFHETKVSNKMITKGLKEMKETS